MAAHQALLSLGFSRRTLQWVAISFSNAGKWKVKVKLLSRVRLCDPTDCSLPGSSIHGIFQTRVLEWVAIIVSVLTTLEATYQTQPLISRWLLLQALHFFVVILKGSLKICCYIDALFRIPFKWSLCKSLTICCFSSNHIYIAFASLCLCFQSIF